MTDFYPHHSTYDHHQQPYSGHSISYTGDAAEDNGIRRTATHGSHQSHSQSHASAVSASTRSWVYSNQMNPPPPPVEAPAPSLGQTPFHGPRPLPDPHVHYQQHHMTPVRRPFQDDVLEEEEEDDYVPPDTQFGGLHFGYQRDGGGPARYIVAGPSSLTSAPSSPVPVPHVPRQNRSVVGGFFKGLKRRMFGGGRDKRRLSHRGTDGNNTELTIGNTLPRYLSNPSIGPSNPQFAHRLSQAVANGSVSPEVTAAAFQLRQPLVSPQQPVVTVTPPSDGAEEEQQAEYFEGPPTATEPPQMVGSENSEHHTGNPMERATVMVYNRESEAPTVTPTRHTSSARASARRSPTVPRVSYQAELPTRASAQAQAQMETFVPASPPAAGSSTTPMTTPPLRPPLQPTPQRYGIASHRTRKGILSPPPTSAYTVTTATSYYDPSFSSHLGPIEKFFTALYRLPWISHGRVTVDYRPGDSPRAKGKIKSLKRPLSSWYHSIMSRSRRNSLDLLSSDGASTGRTSNILSSLASPISRRSGRSSNHRHRSGRSKQHRSRRRHTVSTSTGGMDGTQRSASPIVPTVYPYTVPPYLPYTYPYMPYSGGLPMGSPTPSDRPPSTSRAPRGPRAARSHRRKGNVGGVRYPLGGYAPFQPLVVPPPPPTVPAAGGVYVITPPPPQSQNGDHTAGVTSATATAAPVQLSPVLFHYVPAAYTRGEGVASMGVPPAAVANMMVSPPTTPQKPTASSHHSHHSQRATKSYQ